jgi:predicted DNA-binding protein
MPKARKPKVFLSVRVTEEQKKRLAALAEADGRTSSQMVCRLIELATSKPIAKAS